MRYPLAGALVFLPVLCALRLHAAPLPNFDKRQLNAASAGAAQQAAPPKGAALDVSFDRVTGSPRSVRFRAGLLNGSQGQLRAQAQQDGAEAVKIFVAAHRELFGHGPELLDELTVKHDYTTAHNGLRTIQWQQTLEGVNVFEGALSANVDRNGRLIALSSGLVREPRTAATRGNPLFLNHLKAPPVFAQKALEIA